MAEDSSIVFLHDTVTGAEALSSAIFCPTRVGRLRSLALLRLMLAFRNLENDHVSVALGCDNQNIASLFTNPL
jgi:hypothetical protein